MEVIGSKNAVQRSILLLCSSLLVVLLSTACSFGQSSATYPGGAQNWTGLTWVGGTAPTTNNGSYTENLTVGTIGNGDNLTINISFTLTGNVTFNSSGSNPTVTIPAGVTVVINGNLTDFDNNIAFVVNGSLVVTGTFKGKNNAVFSGTGTISGGTLDLGNGASCSGGCPALIFTTCTQGDAFCTSNVTSGTAYVWTGSSSANWQTAGNWSPTRTAPANADFLTFPGSGANKSITNVPTQTVGSILVTGNSAYSFTPASSGLTLSLSKTVGEALQIDNGSTLSVGASSNTLNLTMPSGGIATVGGQLNLIQGTFTISSATLILHTNSTPLARTNGQITSNSSTILKFGDTGYTSGSTITLPNSIFNGAPTISSLVMNRTNGATLGDQTITIGTSSTFTLGVLNTNSSGRIKFSSSSVSAAESTSSYISGYAEMASTVVGAGALNYLGFNMAAGANNIGSVTLLRRTGATGINMFNGNNSIASSWDVTSTANPAAGRSISFTWQSAFDNGNNSTLRFQPYLSTGSGFNAMGASQFLSAVGPPRQSVSASTTVLNNGTFTLSDQNNTLPVTLTDFTASLRTSDVLLKWETSSELNFDFFSIDKSYDGLNFYQIGKITGQGTSTLKHQYNFTDEKPIVGKNYYRLQSVDFDGHSEYFKVVAIDFVDDRKFMISPNPSDGVSLDINLNFVPEGNSSILVYDNLSNVIAVYTPTDYYQNIVFANSLKSGVYYAKIISGEFVKVERFVVR